MDMHDWATVYHDPAEQPIGDAPVDAALHRYHEFSLAFGRALLDVLDSRRPNLDFLPAYEQAALGNDLLDALDVVQLAAVGRPERYQRTRTFLFHLENRYLPQVWLLLARAGTDDTAWSDQRLWERFWWEQAIRTAAGVVKIATDQERARALHVQEDDESWRETRATRWTLLAETDTLIAAMMICRAHPGMFVVPAPTQFESAAEHANSDLVMLDLTRRRAIGLHATAPAQDTDSAHDDQRRVVLVDSNRDLEDTASLPTSEGSAEQRTEPVPGLVACHLVATRQDYQLQRLGYTDERLARALIADAKAVAGLAPDALPRIAQRLEERVMAAI